MIYMYYKYILVLQLQVYNAILSTNAIKMKLNFMCVEKKKKV